MNSIIQPRNAIPSWFLKLDLKYATSEKYQSVEKERSYNLHEREISPCQAFSNQVLGPFKFIKTSDELSSRYVTIEGLAVSMIDVTSILVYSRGRHQQKSNTILVLIPQWKCRIRELNKGNKWLDQENSWLENYNKRLKKQQERMQCRPIENAEWHYHTKEM